MILFLIAFFFIFILICAKNIRYGIYAIIFLMPLYLWRFSFFSIPMTVLEIMVYILFLAWSLSKLALLLKQIKLKSKLQFNNIVYNTIKRKLFRDRYLVLNVGIILLFLGIIISTALSSDIRSSLGIFKGWFISPLLFFIVFINVIKKERHTGLVLTSWFASGVIVSVVSIFYLLIGDITFDGRLKAIFLSPNHLAMYLTPAFLIVVGFLLKETKFLIGNLIFSGKTIFFRKKMKVIVLLIIVIPLYFTYSYGAFLGIFAGILYLIIKNKDLKIKSIYLSGFFIFLFLGLIFLSSNKFNQIIDSSDRSSFHSRLMILNATGEIIKDNPIFGIGPGTFQKTYLSYAGKFNQPYLEWAVPQPHNIFLAFYLQTGLIGFAGFILILIWFFYHKNIILSHLNKKDKIGDVSVAAEIYIINVLMIYVLVHGLVDTTYWKNDLSLMFWLLIGLAVVNNTDFYRIKSKK